MEIEEYFDQDERYIKLDLEAYLQSKYMVKYVTGYINTMVFPFQERRLVTHTHANSYDSLPV